MISFGSRLFVSDNSGGKLATCIKIIKKNHKKKFASIGDIIKVVINKSTFKGKVFKGEMYNSLIIRTLYNFYRFDGSIIRFNDNSIILLNNKFELIGSRVFGPVCREIKNINYINFSNSIENLI